MPFVRRNKSGKITGHAVIEQDDAKEFLPDDHPEVLEYLARFPPGFLTQPSPEEWRRIQQAQKRLDEEHEKIRHLVSVFMRGFSEVELALSALLYATLHIPKSHVAYAIYYSPTSFDARVEIVENALVQIIHENNELEDLMPLWAEIRKKIDKCRNLRNAVAHGSQITHSINGKKYARLSPPAFDVIRINRVIAKRQIPGLTSNDLSGGCQKLLWCHNRVDEVNRLITTFHADDGTLPEKFAELEAGLKKPYSP